MDVIFVRYLPFILLALGPVVMFLTARPFLIGKDVARRHAQFKSLRRSSPVLNGLIALSVVGKPVLEYFQKNDWNYDTLPFGLSFPVSLVAIASVMALVASIVRFFFRAIRNINFFGNTKIRSPYAAFFMLIPITNIVVLPYLQYFTLERSRRIASPEAASKWRAMALALSSYGLLLVGLAYGRLADDLAQTTAYDPLSLLVLSLSTGGAGGILTSWVIRDIVKAQDLSACQRGLLPAEDVDPEIAGSARSSKRKRWQSIAVTILLTIAVITAVFPQGPAKLLHAASRTFFGELIFSPRS